jgi:hypothetical protein
MCEIPWQNPFENEYTLYKMKDRNVKQTPLRGSSRMG